MSGEEHLTNLWTNTAATRAHFLCEVKWRPPRGQNKLVWIELNWDQYFSQGHLTEDAWRDNRRHQAEAGTLPEGGSLPLGEGDCQQGSRLLLGGNRLLLGGNRPPLEGSRPLLGGSHLPLGGSHPPLEGSHPPQEGSHPPQEGSLLPLVDIHRMGWGSRYPGVGSHRSLGGILGSSSSESKCDRKSFSLNVYIYIFFTINEGGSAYSYARWREK